MRFNPKHLFRLMFRPSLPRLDSAPPFLPHRDPLPPLGRSRASRYLLHPLQHAHRDRSRVVALRRRVLRSPWCGRRRREQRPKRFRRSTPPSCSTASGKRFCCHLCPTAFARKHGLLRHFSGRIHGVEKDFHCPSCAKTFARKDGLKDHVSHKPNCLFSVSEVTCRV